MRITLAILIAALVSGCVGGYGYNGYGYAQPYYHGGYGYNGYGYAQPYYYGGPSLYLSLPPVVIGNYGGYGGYRYGGGYGYRRPYYYQRPYARPYYRPYYRSRW